MESHLSSGVMGCPECGKEIPSDVTFCPYCGFNMQTLFSRTAVTPEPQTEAGLPHCPACGEEVQPYYTACPNCGHVVNQISVAPPPTAIGAAQPAPEYQAQPKPKSHRGRNIVIAVVVVLIVLFVGIPFTVGFMSGLTGNAPQVYLTSVTYNYECPNCATTNWSYSVPMNSSMAEGSTITDQVPFSLPSSQTCSMIVTSVQATTTGFQYSLSPLPLTVHPGQNITAEATVSMPKVPYSGPLDVSVDLSLSC